MYRSQISKKVKINKASIRQKNKASVRQKNKASVRQKNKASIRQKEDNIRVKRVK
jgi:hypothetical protein